MKYLGQVIAIAAVFALSGCATRETNESRQSNRAEARGAREATGAKTKAGKKMVGLISVQRIPGGAPIGVREYKVVFHCTADTTHPTNYNVDGGGWLPVPSGLRTVTSGLHTWRFDALLGGDIDPEPIVTSITAA